MNPTWLVEKRDAHGLCWLPAYLGQLTFSYDINDAVRFARPQDAAAINEELFSGVCSAVCHL